MKEVKVKIEKIHPNAVIPFYATVGSAGLDLTAVSVDYDEQNDRFIYHTGIKISLPVGYEAQIRPCSRNSKKDAYIPNSPGTIDSDYRGEILVVFKNRDRLTAYRPYNVGDVIAQMVIAEVPNVVFEECKIDSNETERGINGFGSTEHKNK